MGLSVKRLARRMAAVGISVALLLPVIGAAPVAACEWGCTPGYWKNHTGMWGASYAPSMTLAKAGFVVPASVGNGSQTLLVALQGGGGSGLEGAGKVLLRAAACTPICFSTSVWRGGGCSSVCSSRPITSRFSLLKRTGGKLF